MDTETRFRCPDCRGMVWLPLSVDLVDGRTVRAGLREDEFEAAFVRHLSFNPELHPTFASRVEED